MTRTWPPPAIDPSSSRAECPGFAIAPGQLSGLALVGRDDVGEGERLGTDARGGRRIEDRGRARRLGDAQGLGRRGGRDLVPDEDDVAGRRDRAGRATRATCPGSSAVLAPPATAMLFSPVASTRIRATPVAWSGSVRSSVTSTPSASRAARAAVPKSSSPTAPTNDVGAPSRAAATAWFPPLPPWCWANRPPVTVSPGRRQSVDRRDEVDVDRADDDHPSGHADFTSR